MCVTSASVSKYENVILITDVCVCLCVFVGVGEGKRGLCIMLGSWSCLGQASPYACTHSICKKGKASFSRLRALELITIRLIRSRLEGYSNVFFFDPHTIGAAYST